MLKKTGCGHKTNRTFPDENLYDLTHLKTGPKKRGRSFISLMWGKSVKCKGSVENEQRVFK